MEKGTCWEFQALNEMHTLAFSCQTYLLMHYILEVNSMLSDRQVAAGPGSCPNVLKFGPNWPRKKSQLLAHEAKL